MWVYVLAIGAAFCFGSGSVVQQRSASQAPPQDTMKLALLWWLVRQRLWLLGLGFSLIGNLMSASALSRGSVALVEPLFTSRLLFALPLAAAWIRRSVPRRDWAGALATALGLGMFVVIGQPHEGGVAHATDWSWLIVGVTYIGLATVLTVVSRPLHPARRAPLLAAGSALCFALQASLISTAMHVLSTHGLLAMLTSWYVYAVIGAALYGTLLLQSAYELAPLPASFPALVAVEPLVSIAIGVGILGGTIDLSPGRLAGEIVGLAVMVYGVVLLATSPLVTGELARMERRQEEGLAYRTEEELEHDLGVLHRDLDRFRLHIAEPRLADKDRQQVHRDLDRIDAEVARLCELFDDIERHRRDEQQRMAKLPAGEARAEAEAHDRQLDDWQRQLDTRALELRDRASRLRERARELTEQVAVEQSAGPR